MDKKLLKEEYKRLLTKAISKCWKMSLKHSLQSFTQVGHCGKEETSTSQSAGK